MSFRSWFSGAWIREKVEKQKEYLDAQRFAESYAPRAGNDYGWVLNHALEEYEMVSARVDTLDTKAASLIGYLGAGSGLISLALVYGLGSKEVAVLWASLPTLLLFLDAILSVIVTRAPAKMPSLPHAKDAFECQDTNGGGAEAKFAARIWLSTVALSLAAREKGRLVRCAFWFFGAAIIWLVGSVLTASFARVFQ